MAKKKQRNFLTGRTHAQQSYHMKRQASKRNREATERNTKTGRANKRRGSMAGCALPLLLVSWLVVFIIR